MEEGKWFRLKRSAQKLLQVVAPCKGGIQAQDTECPVCCPPTPIAVRQSLGTPAPASSLTCSFSPSQRPPGLGGP